MARVLILRQSGRAEETAEALRAAGHVPLTLSVQEIAPTGVSPPPGPFAALIATSVNAVAPLREHFGAAGPPLLAVGEKTAAAARAAGFTAVEAGDGIAANLAGRAAELSCGSGLPLLYAAGRVRSGGLEDALRAAGVPFRLWEVYDTRQLRPDAAESSQTLGSEGPDAVLLLSAGQAEAYAAHLAGQPLLAAAPPVLLCLSERVAARLPPALRARALISPAPTLSSLFDRLG